MSTGMLSDTIAQADAPQSRAFRRTEPRPDEVPADYLPRSLPIHPRPQVDSRVGGKGRPCRHFLLGILDDQDRLLLRPRERVRDD
jgi:hypothetical protein